MFYTHQPNACIHMYIYQIMNQYDHCPNYKPFKITQPELIYRQIYISVYTIYNYILQNILLFAPIFTRYLYFLFYKVFYKSGLCLYIYKFIITKHMGSSDMCSLC